MWRNVVEKLENGDRSRIFFALYSEPAMQKPTLVVSGPREEDKHCSYTVTVRPRFGAPFRLSVLLAVVELRRA